MIRRLSLFAPFCAVVLAAAFSRSLHAQSSPYPNADVRQSYSNLLAAIQQIPIFDDHSHPGFPDDPDVDAMASPPGSAALRIRADNPELIAASKALFEYPYSDFSPEHTRWLIDRKAQLKREQGNQYFSRVLDRLGIETAMANRVAMPDYLDKHRFRWTFFVDSFLFPFDNANIKAQNGDQQVYIPLQERLFHRELQQAGLQNLPDSFDGYLQFVSRILELDRQNGGIAIKFEAAYFRSLYFADPPESQAAGIYSRYRTGGAPFIQEYTVFQDVIFRHLVREAGRLHLAVHFHTSVGIGDFFSLHNGNVLNLENVLRDPRYDSVTFVLLHGGFPYERQVIWLAARKNVYVDSSLTDLYLYPSEFKQVLKYWLSIYPEKVVFGSDAFPFNEALGAEEAYWLSVQSSREALAAALSELVSEHAFTKDQAMKIAHAYLHDTAAQLYNR
ncbi:MAG: amidohydrolase family protein [Bryobacteraceae bacterium]